MKRLLEILVATLICCPVSLPAGLPQPVIPEGMGVNIHFVTGQEKDLDLIAAAGFRWVRMDFQWAGIEQKTNRYDWAGYDELLGNLEKRGLKALFILDYSNPLYEQMVRATDPVYGAERVTTASPQRPESIAAFARWAGAAAARYTGRPVIWEIWNEPNIFFWAPKPDADQYVALAKATCAAIRKADPRAVIVGPATSGFPWEFLERCFKAGLLESLDAVTVHPYRDYKHGPETASADYKKLRNLIDRYAPAGKAGAIPILSGEWGYATHEKGVSLETQAAFAVRQQLANLLNQVRLSIWYDWKNDGPDLAEREHNFGTVYADLKLKPAYEALRTMTTELKGYAVAERLPLPGESIYVVACTNAAGQKKLAAWTTGEPQLIDLQIDPGTARATRVVEGLGAVHTPAAPGKLKLLLEAIPQYVTLETVK